MTVRSEINGSIQIKSYLQGNPEIRLGLNSNIVLGRDKDISSKRKSSKSNCICNNKHFLSKT
jgi:hypothetical protein